MRYAIGVVLAVLGCGSEAAPPTPALAALQKTPASKQVIAQPSLLQKAIESAAAKHAARAEALCKDLTGENATVGALRDQIKNMQEDRVSQLAEVAGVAPGEVSPEREAFKVYLAAEETYLTREAELLERIIKPSMVPDRDGKAGNELIIQASANDALIANTALLQSEAALLALMKKSGLTFSAPYASAVPSRAAQLSKIKTDAQRAKDIAILADPDLPKDLKDKASADLKTLDEAAKTQPASAP